MKRVKPDDYEFSVLLGDCLEAYPNEGELFRAWRAYLELLDGAEKPVIFVRGNHDTRQSFASRLAYLFDLPNLSVAQPWGDDQWQFTLRAGPAWLLAMDTGEDENGVNTDARTAYKQPEFWRSVRRREPDAEAASRRQTRRRRAVHLFLSHIPLYNNNEWDSPSSREYWEPILLGTRLDLMLAGHDHGWSCCPKRKGSSAVAGAHRRRAVRKQRCRGGHGHAGHGRHNHSVCQPAGRVRWAGIDPVQS